MTGRDLDPLTLDPDVDPWERQPGETTKRYGQFATYRDLGRVRTLAKVAETLALNASYVRSVAAAMKWAQRAEAFDRWRDDLHQRAWLEKRREAADIDARLLGAAIAKLAGRLQSLRVEDLTPDATIRLLDVAMRHRRALFGDPAMTVAVTGPGGDPIAVQLAEFTALPADQRRKAIADLADTVRRRMAAGAGNDDD